MMATIQPIPADGIARESRHDVLVPTARGFTSSPFCDFLERQGGLHLWFAEYLKYRSDLLRGRTLLALQALPSPVWNLSRDQAIALLQADFGDGARGAIATLSDSPYWSSGLSCAYRAQFEYRPVVVQFSRPPFPGEEFLKLERSLAAFDDHAMECHFGPLLLLQFREWTMAGLAPAAGRAC